LILFDLFVKAVQLPALKADNTASQYVNQGNTSGIKHDSPVSSTLKLIAFQFRIQMVL